MLPGAPGRRGVLGLLARVLGPPAHTVQARGDAVGSVRTEPRPPTRKLAALRLSPRRRGDDSRVALGVEGEVGPPAPAYRLSGIKMRKR